MVWISCITMLCLVGLGLFITIKPFELRNGFGIIGLGMACSCAPAFSFVSILLDGTTTELSMKSK